MVHTTVHTIVHTIVHDGSRRSDVGRSKTLQSDLSGNRSVNPCVTPRVNPCVNDRVNPCVNLRVNPRVNYRFPMTMLPENDERSRMAPPSPKVPRTSC